MSTAAPMVSIGMPVRNGENYIRRAIDSIRAQTFTDWELVICDNASTDATETIVDQYTKIDSRIRYHRNGKDVGPAGNHNLCVERSSGRYFRWHAHDDMIAPSYLTNCVAALEADSSIVCAHSGTQIVDGNDAFLENYDFVLRTDSHSPAKRFAELVLVKHRLHRAVEIFGLMRASALRQTPLEGAFARGDSVLLARMALLGRFVVLPGRDFLSRSHPSQSMQQLPSRLKGRNGNALWSACLGTGPLPPPEWWDKSLKGRVTFPEWKLFVEYCRAVSDTKLSSWTKLKSNAVLGLWLFLNSPKLARDLIVAFEQTLDGLIHPLVLESPKKERTLGGMVDEDDAPIAMHGQ